MEEHNAEVITVTVDTGGFTKGEIQEIKEKSKKLGAIKHYSIDAKQEVYDKIVTYIIKGNVLRGGVYPLCAGAERVIQAQKIASIAKKENASAIAHGSTGAGNDQVRFDVAFSVLAPEKEIITPYRDLELSREYEYEYLKKKGFSVNSSKKEYSINEGLLGVTIGGKETNSSWGIPPNNVYKLTKSIEESDNSPEYVEIEFVKGVPVKINSKSMTGIEILSTLNKISSNHGVGRGIHLGNTFIGIKGRLAFEAPAMLILIKAHKELEKLVLTKLQSFWKGHLSNLYGDLLHEAKFFDPIMRDLEQFIDSTQQKVTGKVKLKLFKGNIIVEGCKSPFSLMDQKVATYAEGNKAWKGQDARGFCKLYGIQSILANNVGNGDNHEN